MSIIGDSLIVSQTTPGYIRLFMQGMGSSSSSDVVLGASSRIVSYDSEYFSYDSSTRKFTVLKAGTYNMRYIARGAYNRAQGTLVDFRIKITHSGSTSNNVNQTNVNYQGVTGSKTVSLSVGDLIFATGKAGGGWDAAFVLYI